MVIAIVTNKPYSEIEQQIIDIRNSLNIDCKIITSCMNASASINRNYCCAMGESDIMVMMDDDVSGFTKGWIEDLIEPLEDNNIIMVSARLLKTNGTYGDMIDFGHNIDNIGIVEIKQKYLPGACIAFRQKDIKALKSDDNFPDNDPFDIGYKKASYEDTDFCMALSKKYPAKKFVVNNNVKIIHQNAESWRPGFRWQDNQEYFYKKWGNK